MAERGHAGRKAGPSKRRDHHHHHHHRKRQRKAAPAPTPTPPTSTPAHAQRTASRTEGGESQRAAGAGKAHKRKRRRKSHTQGSSSATPIPTVCPPPDPAAAVHVPAAWEGFAASLRLGGRMDGGACTGYKGAWLRAEACRACGAPAAVHVLECRSKGQRAGSPARTLLAFAAVRNARGALGMGRSMVWDLTWAASFHRQAAEHVARLGSEHAAEKAREAGPKLQAALAAAEAAADSDASDPDSSDSEAGAAAARLQRERGPLWLAALCALDDLYMALFYEAASTEQHRPAHHPAHGSTPAPPAVPPPELYFPRLAWDGRGERAALAQLVTARIRCSRAELGAWLPGVWGVSAGLLVGDEAVPADNPLLALFIDRWREGVHLFGGRGSALACSDPGRCGPEAAAAGVSPTMKGRDPVASPELHVWRDAVRDYACHLYSFAVPTEEALAELGRHGALLEVGAGTAYWAALLRRRGVDVVACDVAPPDQRDNEYHGRARPFGRVVQGGVEQVGRQPGRTLFLCYPPPDSEMGARALAAYRGRVFSYVGEWRGDTGTPRLEQALRQGWTLARRVPLPNFGNTCYALTVWTRHDAAPGASPRRLPAACAACGRQDGVLRRCRFSCAVYFCSSKCQRAGWPEHRRRLALRLLFFDSLDFGNKAHFRAIKARAT